MRGVIFSGMIIILALSFFQDSFSPGAQVWIDRIGTTAVLIGILAIIALLISAIVRMLRGK